MFVLDRGEGERELHLEEKIKSWKIILFIDIDQRDEWLTLYKHPVETCKMEERWQDPADAGHDEESVLRMVPQFWRWNENKKF